MKKLILSIVFALATLPMFSYSLETLYVFSYLRKFVEKTNPIYADMLNKFESPCYCSIVRIVDCNEQPNKSHWSNFGMPDKNFNMEFGLYEVGFAYMLIHHKSLSIYMGGTVDKLLERVIEIKEKEPNLIMKCPPKVGQVKHYPVIERVRYCTGLFPFNRDLILLLL